MKLAADEARYSIATEPGTAAQRKLAAWLIVAIALTAGLIYVFALRPLPRSDGFVPVAQSIIFALDVLTAILLFGQFAVSRSVALIVLATGYLSSALFAMVHTLTFPGTIAPDGLFGETAGWVYIAWHACFPLGAVVYCLLRPSPGGAPAAPSRPVGALIAASIAASIGLVVVVTVCLILADGSLPPFVVGPREFNPFVRYVSIGNLILAIAALAMLQRRRETLLDEWLRVAVVAATAEAALVVLVAGRYTVVFYGGRVLAVVAAGALVSALLWEVTRLFAKHAGALGRLERERANKLTNFGRMIGAVTHEIRQPLAVIALRTAIVRRLLAEPRPDLEQIGSSLNELEHAGDRVIDTIDGIRALYRNSAEDHELLNVDEQLVHPALRLLEPELDERGIALEHEADPGLPSIRGHRRQLQEVVLNIARNAIESMETVGDRPRVLHVRTERADEDRIVITIEDSGAGIEPERIATLFDALTTTKPGGTGLGLGICRMIVDQHHGELRVRSTLGRGSAFSIVLPLKPRVSLPLGRAAEIRRQGRDSSSRIPWSA